MIASVLVRMVLWVCRVSAINFHAMELLRSQQNCPLKHSPCILQRSRFSAVEVLLDQRRDEAVGPSSKAAYLIVQWLILAPRRAEMGTPTCQMAMT